MDTPEIAGAPKKIGLKQRVGSVFHSVLYGSVWEDDKLKSVKSEQFQEPRVERELVRLDQENAKTMFDIDQIRDEYNRYGEIADNLLHEEKWKSLAEKTKFVTARGYDHKKKSAYISLLLVREIPYRREQTKEGQTRIVMLEEPNVVGQELDHFQSTFHEVLATKKIISLAPNS